MRKWQWKKSMAVVLSITMVLSLAGCGAEEAKTAEVGAVFEEKPVRISKAELNGAYTADYEKAETVYALYRLSYCPKGQAGLEPATTSLIEVTVSYASGITLLSLLPLQLSTFLSIFPAVPPW